MIKIKIKYSRKAVKSQSSAQIVASIDDLLMEILLRLPIKSLICFKLVSKHWHSLITSPGFCILRSPNPNPAIGLFLPCFYRRTHPWFEYVPFSLKQPSNPPFRELKLTKEPSGLKILQSCNGLFLCCTFHVHDCYRRYYIYNPTTRKISKLPKLYRGGYGVSARVHGISLAFDPAKSPHYKVLCTWGWELDSGDYQYQFDVYSSNMGPWRKYGEPFQARINFEGGVYWNGAIHWINDTERGDFSYFEAGDLLYFNPDDHHNPQIMPSPPIPMPDRWEWRSNWFFGESCDHLHYIEIFGPNFQFDVYEMKRDYSEWFVKHKVDLAPVFAAYIPNPDMIWDNFNSMDWTYFGYSISTLVRGDKEKDSFLILQIPGKIVRYNLVYKTFEAVREFESVPESQGGDHLPFPNVKGFQYIESLCCV